MEHNLDIEGLTSKTLDNLLEGFQLIDYNWRHCYVNDAVVAQSNYSSKEDLLGYTMMEKYPGIEHTELFKTLKKSMNERVSLHLETKFKLPDKTEKWFELRIEPVPQGIFILSIDITDRKKEEENNLKYASGLEEMIFITSHKVRQPVTNLLGLTRILSRKMNSQDKLEKIVCYIKESIESLDLFTKELSSSIYDLKQKGEGEDTETP